MRDAEPGHRPHGVRRVPAPRRGARRARWVAAAGGKGVNVARAAHRLGAQVLAAAPIGGATGDQVAAMLAPEGIDRRWTPIAGTTRTCTIIVAAKGDATVLNEAGPRIDAEEWRRFADDVGTVARNATYVTISGSAPPGVAPGGFRALIDAASRGGAQVWVDTSGRSLAEALGSGVRVKVNHLEAALQLGVPAPEPPLVDWAVDASFQIRGPMVVITLGAAGAVLRSGREVWHAAAPNVEVVNTVGSGDSFLAGLVTGMDRGGSPEEVLAFAVACGAAKAAVRLGADLTDVAVENLVPQVDAKRIASPPR